jgi:integrase
LKKIAEWLHRDFDTVERRDIERIILDLARSDYSPWTKHDYKVAIKRFYKWLNGNEEYSSSVKWIKTTFKAKDALLPKDLLDEEEVMQLVNAADRPWDKAFIMTLYESGARIGELGTMRVRDVALVPSDVNPKAEGTRPYRREMSSRSFSYSARNASFTKRLISSSLMNPSHVPIHAF